MHLKFLARGTGSAAVAAAYLLALKDASGKVRAAVEVLRGDPMLVAAIADGLPFMHRYTSGVGAWSPEDAPTRPELERFVDEFEKTAWAGLERDRYVWAAVLHRDDDGGAHLHFFAARCDLATGLSLNIAPPGWERTFDPLRDAFNYEHGWSRPDDPSRARAFRPAPHRAYQARAARRAGEGVEPDPRREIGMHLLELVEAGKVKDRAGVVAALEARGYDVPRQGEHYVTARDPATGERWRLKGALYERDFDRARFLREAPEPSVDRERADGVDDPAAAAWEAVEKARRRRADYNRAYYGSGRLPGRAGVQVAVGPGEVERASGPAAGRSAGHDASLAAHLERELGDGAVAAVAPAAESVRARRAATGGGRGERSLTAAAALAEAGRAASPELSRLLGEHEDVTDRELAVCTTSMGDQWLAEAQQEALAEEEDRPLSVGLRTRAVKTVEGRLETHLSRRASAVAATSSGPALLQKALGKRSYGDAPLSFSARERGLEQVEQRIDEELRTREEALRAIPPSKQFLLAAEQARAGGAAGPPTLADRESMVRAATQQAGEEIDRREKELIALAVGEDLLAESVGALAGDGRTRSLGERWETCERVRNGVEEELDRREAAIREFLRDARLEVLGSAEREAATLGERARIIKAAAEAKRQAETWNEEKADRIEKLRALPGGLDLYHAHLTDRDPKRSLTENTPPSRELDEAALAAAESDDTRLKRLRDVLSDDSDAACYQEVLDQVVGQFTTSDLDRALAGGEKARAERELQQWCEKRDARVDALANLPGGLDLYHAHLADRDPKWDRKRNRKSSRENIDAALAAAESDAPRLDRLRAVLSDKSAPACYREVLGQVVGQFKTPDLDRALAAGEREQQRAAERRREAENRRRARVEKREEALRATSLGGRWLAKAHQEARAEAGRELVLVVRERIADTVESRFVGNLVRREAALAATASGLALLQEAYGAAGIVRPPANLLTRERVVEQGEWEAKRDARFEALGKQPGGTDLFHAYLADLDPARDRTKNNTTTRENIDAALTVAESDGRRQERLRAVLSDEAAAARYHGVLEDSAGQFTTTNLDSALAAAERDQEERRRVFRVERLFGAPRAAEAFIVALEEPDPSSRTPAHPNIDQALDIAEREFGREAEQRFPGASSATGRRAGDDVTEAADTGRDVQQVIEWLRTEVERRQFEALRARTGAARLDQRNRNSLRRPVVSPPVPKPDRLVPDATWEDAVAAALVRARLPEAERQGLRLGVDLAARELAGEFGGYQWWSHAGGELDELHRREDRYLEFSDTKEGPVEIGMLRTVLERDVYEKAFPLVEHPVAEPDPPANLVELVRPFIQWLQNAVGRLIDRVLDREPAQPPRPAAAVAPAEPSLRQPVSSDASPPPATAPAPEPAAVSVTEAERVRVAVHFVEAKLPRTNPYPGNPSHRPPALSDERLDHLAAATDDEFVKMVIAELQRRQGYYTDSERSESEKRHLRPDIAQKNEEKRHAYKEAEAARSFFSRRPPEPTWAEAESVVIKEFETKQLVLIEGVCRTIQQRSPATIRHEFQRMEPERAKAARMERDEDLSERSSHIDQTEARDRDPGQAR